MSNAAFTKLMIAQGLKRLLKTTSFVNVSVGDIARECKISRNTFYYHFKDKYDLISWIFYTEITSILSDDISLGQAGVELRREQVDSLQVHLTVDLNGHGQKGNAQLLSLLGGDAAVAVCHNGDLHSKFLLLCRR